MRMKINGKDKEIKCGSLFELKVESGLVSDHLVVILNGFQTNADLPLNEGDEVVFTEKGKMPGQDEFEAMISARHTPQVYEKAKQTRVAVVGLGGLGSTIAVALARTGGGDTSSGGFRRRRT